VKSVEKRHARFFSPLFGAAEWLTTFLSLHMVQTI